MKGIIKI